MCKLKIHDAVGNRLFVAKKESVANLIVIGQCRTWQVSPTLQSRKTHSLAVCDSAQDHHGRTVVVLPDRCSTDVEQGPEDNEKAAEVNAVLPHSDICLLR